MLNSVYQITEVRNRIIRGLVGKKILGTERRAFLFFEVEENPIVNPSIKDAILRRTLALLTSNIQTLQPQNFYIEDACSASISFKFSRAVCLLCCSLCGDVLGNALDHLDHRSRKDAVSKANLILNQISQWPMAPDLSNRNSSQSLRIGTGAGNSSHETATPGNLNLGDANVNRIVRAVQDELTEQGSEAQFKSIAAILHVLSQYSLSN